MRNDQNLAAGTILLGGVMLAAGVFAFSALRPVGETAAAPPPQWTQAAGLGVSVPACSSSSASVTCSGSAPSVAVSWSYGGQHGTCGWANVSVSGGPSWNNQACSGSVTWNGAAISTSYSYAVSFIYDAPSTFVCTGFDEGGGCVGGFSSDPPPAQIDSYSGSFTTPNCALLANQTPVAAATISGDGTNYTDSITVTRGMPTPVYLSAAGSSDPDGWTNPTLGVSNGGKCEWNSDLNQGAPAFETTVSNPASPSACNISLGTLTFNDTPGTYTYSVLRITDGPGAVSTVDAVSVTVEAGGGGNGGNGGGGPTADIKANGSDGPVTIASNTSATITWCDSPATPCANATSCSVSPTGWSGISGTQSTGNLTSSQTYSLSCSRTGITAHDSVTVNISGAPPPECSDGIDNIDPEDTIADYPNDPGCSSLEDNDERNACTDGIDNDGDGLIDFPSDPGCSNPQDNDEKPLPLFKEIPPE